MGAEITSVRAALAVPPGPVNLAGYDPGAKPVEPDSKLDPPSDDPDLLRELQERLWAESTAGGTRRVLLVLQGMDTAGKGGVTEHVVGMFGPIGVQYNAFKRPTEEELEHDFLWRIRKRLPPPGVVGVFDRSHYEDVVVVRVHDLVPREEWEARYDIVNEFEKELVDAGTTVLKCFLHISYDTQRERLLARLDNPDKHWKFNEADIAERARWTDYQAAYEAVLERCNTDHAPWYVVPADRKKYRNWAVGELLRETLAELDPAFPRPTLDLNGLRQRLEPPH
ncbi:MAG TPA: PPK2 family polyphosphate kinase [Jatrophihabitans sp.]|jgi:PPK2 family polyphosphate:nucleotide phosphotransferase|uniref:PPK2 family polyphosphate kinase n=1 Tax=Jatrophihabitans sp. TaxID=1932789 RepID=UPI002E0324D9|nr:PPK2 family polyphosphate kinase [Jatrophihabitans sp.]